MTLNLVKFEPGTFIEISDTMKGFRKLAVVTEGGDMYFDAADETATPFPIYEALEPRNVGNSLSWGLELADKNPAEHKQFGDLHSRLVESGADTLTVNRALYWAVQNHVYDYSRALAAGKAASGEVAASRAMMDNIIARGANA